MGLVFLTGKVATLILYLDTRREVHIAIISNMLIELMYYLIIILLLDITYKRSSQAHTYTRWLGTRRVYDTFPCKE